MQGFKQTNKKSYSSKCSEESWTLTKCNCSWAQKTGLSFIPEPTACCNRNVWKGNCWNLTFCFSFHSYNFFHDLPNTLEFMLQQMPNSVAFLTPLSISNKEDTRCKGEAELQFCTVSNSLYSKRNLTGLYIAFKPQFIAAFLISVWIPSFITLPFTNFFQLEPDSNCNYNDFIFHKKYVLFSTIKRTELSSFLHSFSFINILVGISLQSC